MSQEVFDNAQLSTMRLAVDRIIEERASKVTRTEVARTVFRLASETSEFDLKVLVRKARERLPRDTANPQNG